MAVHLFSQVALGLGELTIGGVSVGWLKGEVNVQVDGELLEAWSGTPARCRRRSWTKQWAKITASIAEINSSNISYFLSAGQEVLPEHNIVFTHTEPDGGVTVTVSMTANVIPTGGMKFREDTWTLTGVEFRSVGDGLVSVTAT